MANLSLDYPGLAALTAVVAEGSFEKAARLLSITASAVSQRVKALEERVGAILVIRAAPCRPTIVGERLVVHFERVQLLEKSVFGSLPNLMFDGRSASPTIRVAVNGDSLSTWFPSAVKAFVNRSDSLLDLVLVGEEQTAELLRSGNVLAAITDDPTPVQGCKIINLGVLRYVAVASPKFCSRYFASGVNAQTITHAPMLRVNRDDVLQARWISAVVGAAVASPTHWVPNTQGFVDLLRAGLGWGMVPQALAKSYLSSNELREIEPSRKLNIDLYWQYSQLFTHVLQDLNRSVASAARASLLGLSPDQI